MNFFQPSNFPDKFESKRLFYQNDFYRMLNVALPLMCISVFNCIFPGRPLTEESVEEWQSLPTLG